MVSLKIFTKEEFCHLCSNPLYSQVWAICWFDTNVYKTMIYNCIVEFFKIQKSVQWWWHMFYAYVKLWFHMPGYDTIAFFSISNTRIARETEIQAKVGTRIIMTDFCEFLNWVVKWSISRSLAFLKHKTDHINICPLTVKKQPNHA